MILNYSFELHEFNEAITSYGVIETQPPEKSDIIISNFQDGDHFRTGVDDNKSLVLQLEDRLLTFIVDESGSMTWNDNNNDRYTYLKRLLTKLESTYPGTMTSNLIGFGGVPIRNNLVVTKSDVDFLKDDERQQLAVLLQSSFQDSVYDFAGVRVVRRTDRFPLHPADGTVVGEGIFDAIKDENLQEGTKYYYGVWTFNKELNFSQGQFVSGSAHDRILPFGVNLASAFPRILPGVRRDNNTQIIYNFSEGSGTMVFDSSGQGKHAILGSEVIEENFWLGDGSKFSGVGGTLVKSVGVRFDGMFDILEADIDDGIAVTSTQDITVNVWVYRYDIANHVWVIGTSKLENSNNIGWAIGITQYGEVGYQFSNIISGFSVFVESDGGPGLVIPLETWTMITVVMRSTNIMVYINGVLAGTATVNADSSGMDKLYIGAKPEDSATSWIGQDYFGLLSQVSIHNTARSAFYIQDLYNSESVIFGQSLQSSLESPPDNNQREVLISWEIGEDFNYEGGEVRIVRKYRSIPKHENDGDIILIRSAVSGQFFFLDTTDDLINNANYYYRIFTFNSLGNPCDRTDARIIPVHIPESINPVAIPELSPVNNVLITNGDQKVMIQWSNPSDSRWVGTKVFYSPERYPTISNSPQGNLEVSDGFELTDTIGEFFVHRKVGITDDGVAIPLQNDRFHFYTIVTYDRLNRVSDALFAIGIPSSDLGTVFPPAEVEDLHLDILNPQTLSVQWINPIVKTDTLELFFGESALIFVSFRDIFGGELEDLNNIKLQVCTEIFDRELTTKERILGALGPADALQSPCGPFPVPINGPCSYGVSFDTNCNNEREERETVLNFSALSSGLIKGILTHTQDSSILTRRERYEMSIRAQYKVEDPLTKDLLFELHTEPVRVSFQHPLEISLINKQNRKVQIPCGTRNIIRGETICSNKLCDNIDQLDTDCDPPTVNGGYINSTIPYIVRVELQYKGGSLPDGTPVHVSLFKHNEENPLSEPSARTSIQEGLHSTSVIQESLLDFNGNPTGDIVSKSIVDIEIPSPSLPDVVDVYVSINFLGFFVDAIHTVNWLGSLFIKTEATAPLTDGIDRAEQFATVWTVDPDDPENPNKTVPVQDGTLVKWELVKLRFAKDRPFYSEEPISTLISGVYSSTVGGVARNVFLGPVGNITPHFVESCGEICCIGEEYAIKASVFVDEQNASDSVYVTFGCSLEEDIILNRKFFMNAAENQPGEAPNYVTWADGESLLHFKIAQNSALILDSQIPGSSCFRQCLESRLGGAQLIPLPENHIVQITAPAEILWNVTFDEDPYTGELVVVSSESVSPAEGSSFAVAGIPISGNVTDFYLRINKFVGETGNPQPQQCGNSGGGGLGGGGNTLLSCEWENICFGVSDCNIVRGVEWDGVVPITGTTTLTSDNLAITLTAGGGYDDGIPPILVGFKEPLDVRVIETRVNGKRTSNQELVVDGVSQHTIVVEVKFANKPVPSGTPVELMVDGSDADIVILSNCINAPPGCSPGNKGVIYTNLVNDPFINPDGDKRSLAYFSIDPLPNVAFNAKINVTCRYDKLGTVERQITRCVELNNTVNVDGGRNPLQPPGTEPIATSVVSNESIVYDTISDLYSTTKAGQINRIAHFVASRTTGTSDTIYVFGGFTDHDLDGFSKITASGEKFDVGTATWTFVSNMPTARAGGMVVSDGTNIYCIGGLESDTITETYKVSRKNEAFNIVTGTWNPSLASLPENYGIAFGDAQIKDGFIYVLCGVKTVINNNQPGDLNDKILRYSIKDDTWIVIHPSDLDLYQRISPFGFYRSNPLPVTNTTIDINIEDGLDDAISVSGAWTTDGTVLIMGQTGGGVPYYDFLRFKIPLDPGKLVVSASISLTTGQDHSETAAQIDITYLDLDDIGNFSTDYSLTPVTGTPVRWNITSPFQQAGTRHTSPDIKDLIQDFVNRPGYTKNSYIAIRFDGTPGAIAAVKEPYSYEGATAVGAAVPTLHITYLDTDTTKQMGYIYGGSVPKSMASINAEFNEKFNQRLNDFRSFILTSPYFLSLTEVDQEKFIEDEEEKIASQILIPPFIYPATGFKYSMGEESQDSDGNWVMDISDKIDDEWTVLPKARDRGQAIYIPNQDIVYFMGGSNQGQSTTLNHVESIDLTGENNVYSRLTAFSRGRAFFGAIAIQDDIYLSGGITSGHKEGYVEIELFQSPDLIEARGTQSSGVVIFLRDDSGELITQNIRCLVRGRLSIPKVDAVLSNFLSSRAADRALGGDGSGNAPDVPKPGDKIDFAKLIAAQNKIVDPNSDEFQFNAAKKLDQQVFLFPVLYSEQEIVIKSGVGGVTLLPRSEDPFGDIERLSQFIENVVANTPVDSNERFEGDLTRDELIALGDALKTVRLPPTVMSSNTIRNLYQIETVVTVLDDFYFGQTVSDFDLNLQEQINKKVETILTPPSEDEEESSTTSSASEFGGIPISDSECFLLQHVAASEIPAANMPSSSVSRGSNPGITGGFSQSGQCLFCNALLPLNPAIKLQLPTVVAQFYNTVEWIPQIKKRITNGGSLSTVLKELDIIDHEVPFGSSQLYTAMQKAAIVSTGEEFESQKKVFYITSDNSENLSLVTRTEAIDEINAVDGNRKSPVIYPIFSTSFPLTLSSQLERTEVGDIQKIVEATGGQSSTLTSTGFLDQILNLTIGGATGGLGWGQYMNRINFDQLSAITDVTTDFCLPSNTQGFLRFRYSVDGFNFTDFTERFEGSQSIDFVDFFAKVLEFEIVLTTGFTLDITEEYDTLATGIPKLVSISWGTSGEREDFIFLNNSSVLTNVQQLAASFEGTIPPSSQVEIGVASSNSHDWRDFQSRIRPAIKELGKTFLIERTNDPNSVVPIEPLFTRDGLLYTAAYGSWDPKSTVKLFNILDTGEEIPILSGFRVYPRHGEVYFDTRQSMDAVFKIAITNSDTVRVGLRLLNRLHTDSISLEGVGYIYSTNDDKPIELSQVAPRAVNVRISPSSPNSSDTIFALYDYIDLNGDPESGTIIKWFKNNVQLSEINNRESWSNSDLIFVHRLAPLDRVYFAVIPSDGRELGTTVYSPTVTIVARPPSAENLVIVATRNDIINPRFDTGSVFTAKYNFVIEDLGDNTQESGTIIKWFVNGVLFKEGTFTEELTSTTSSDNSSDNSSVVDARQLVPGEITGGELSHVIGNEITVEVTPKTPFVTGDTAVSAPIRIVNSIPIVSNILIEPQIPTVNSTLQLTYTFDDPDVGAPNSTQTDQSEIRWLVSVDGVDFVENTSLRGNTTVPPFFISAGEKWQVEIAPFDGLDLGVPSRSNVVTIQSS